LHADPEHYRRDFRPVLHHFVQTEIFGVRKTNAS